MANTDFQQPTFVWFFRIVQFVFAIIVLGVAGSSISDFTSDGCKSPGKLDFNVAVAVLTMVAMAYLIFSTGKAAFAPFNKWAQLSLDAVFVILWIVCCGTSNYTCDDLCSACYGGDECYCWDVVKKREVKSTLMSRAPVTSVRRASKGSYAKAAGKLGKWASKLGVNVVML
ncbi:MAG: Ribosomal RNA-processing protein 7 [Chaenotheca gracillima]|nr:MAG: Ribosomal RNA-processing protein 7 [Chaenotheca gracillima]